MDRFLQDATSSYWWLSVVVVGVIINVLSAYLKPFLESRLSHLSDYWGKRHEAKIGLFNQRVSLLRSNPELRVIYAMRELRYRVRMIGFIVLSIVMLLASKASNYGIFGFISLNFLGVVFILFALADQMDAMKVKKLIESSIDGISELDP
jgi:hypothetical protein